MNRKRRVAGITAMVLIILMHPALLAWGNPPPGRWEKVTETKPGDKMIIYMKDGAQHTHRFASLNDKSLICKNDYDEQFQFDLVEVDKIVLPKTDKYAKQGALWGTVGGAIGGAIISTVYFYDFVPSGHVATAGVGAGLGALGGLIVGASLGAPGETIYISKEAALDKAN